MSYTKEFYETSSSPSSYRNPNATAMSVDSVTSFFKTYWMYIVGVIGVIVLLIVVWYVYNRRSNYVDTFFE